ncbi:MAG: Fic family protein [Candidatus Woesearchaeota archaeon]
MNRRKSIIKGIAYWYWADRIYINRGVTKQVSFSMGRVDKATKESLNRRKQEILKEIIEREIKSRVDYWNPRISYRSVFNESILEKIERLRTELMRFKTNLGDVGNGAMETAFLVDFIYNSNKLEGSRLPRDEVQKLLERDLQKDGGNEVINTAQAKEFVDVDFKWNIKHLRKLQSILLAHEPSKIGIRKSSIVVGNDDSLLDPSHIKTSLEGLFQWLKDNRFSEYPPELAFEFYYRFERIHPFIDGNGRVGRLLMNKILKDSRFHPIIVWDKNRRKHFNAFLKASQDQYLPKFFEFMSGQMIKTYDAYSEKIEKAVEFDSLVNHFLSPSE